MCHNTPFILIMRLLLRQICIFMSISKVLYHKRCVYYYLYAILTILKLISFICD